MHECYIRKDAAGKVRVWFRKSSRSSTWLPDGEGFDLFPGDTRPQMPQPIAVRKADVVWGRDLVKATIRAWFPSMVVDAVEMAEIKAEWAYNLSGQTFAFYKGGR